MKNDKPETMSEALAFDSEWRRAVRNAGSTMEYIHDNLSELIASVFDVYANVCTDCANASCLYDTDNCVIPTSDRCAKVLKKAFDEMSAHKNDILYNAVLVIVKEKLPYMYQVIDLARKYKDLPATRNDTTPIVRIAKIIRADNRDMLSCDQDRAELTFSDGSTKELKWWGDEISFTESELVGKTWDEIDKLYSAKDIAYIRG